MKIRAKYKFSTKLILIFGAIGFSFLTWNIFNPMLGHRYIQIPDLLLTIVSVVFAIGCFYYLFKNEVILLENNKLHLTSFFGLSHKEYDLSNLKFYTAIQKENKYMNWEDLDIYFPKDKVRITSSNYKSYQYQKLKNAITKNLQENQSEKDKQGNKLLKWWGFGCIVIGTFLLLISINQDSEGKKLIGDSNTKVIEGFILNDLEISTGRRNKKSIIIKLNTIPNFALNLNRPEIEMLREEDFINEVSKGDKIGIKIWKEVYDKKIAETKHLSFGDKHINFHNIEILGISKSKKEYLSEKSINKAREKFHTKGNYYGLICFALFVFGLGIYLALLSSKA